MFTPLTKYFYASLAELKTDIPTHAINIGSHYQGVDQNSGAQVGPVHLG